MHCHIELHNVGGMAMMFHEEMDDKPPVPYKFPECRNFPFKGTRGVAKNGPRITTTASQASQILRFQWFSFHALLIVFPLLIKAL